MKENNDITILFALFLTPFIFLISMAILFSIDISDIDISNVTDQLVSGFDYFIDALKNNGIYYVRPQF